MSEIQSDVVKKHFNSLDDYDTCCDHVVPNNPEIQEFVYRHSLASLKKGLDPTHVLDLGIGTATGASIFLLDNPAAKLTGVDFSEKMLSKARKHIMENGLTERTEMLNADFTEWEMPAEKFDICFSTIAIHNVTDDAKKALFKKIYSALKSGGVFINGDFIRFERDIEHKNWSCFYETYLRSNLSGAELETWLRHAFQEDKPAKLSDQKKWLLEAGFSDFRLLWQKNNLAVYAARK